MIEGDKDFPVWAWGCEIRGIEFKTHDYVAYYPSSSEGINNVKFGQLQVVVACSQEKELKLIVTRQDDEEDDVMAAWEVQDTGEVESVPAMNLACHCPFSGIRAGSRVMISKVVAPTVDR